LLAALVVGGLASACTSQANDSGSEHDKLAAIEAAPLTHVALATDEVARETVPVGAGSQNDLSYNVVVGLRPGTLAEAAAAYAAGVLRTEGDVRFSFSDCSVPGVVGLEGMVTVRNQSHSWVASVLLSVDTRPAARGVGRVKPPLIQLDVGIPRNGNGGVSVPSPGPGGCPSVVTSAL